ncbi:MAG: hypothetical protein AUG81_08110 [Verrucomicrobia bacterium 13_1_20CM_4_54_11]|nr:MAG: hypothetical protein AUG81_08110 [Verrucomicrobia bacterium 13_1_20CM_4_54_11]
MFIWNFFAKFGRFIVANRRVKRFGTQANTSQSRHFFSGNPQLFTEFALSRFATELVAHLR